MQSKRHLCCWGPTLVGFALALPPAADGQGLDNLFRMRDATSHRSSSADPNWQNGNGDARRIGKGETLELCDVEGPGIIRHIWFTFYGGGPKFTRALILRMYWDGNDEPAVESPLGDFFAVGNGATRLVDSIPVAITSDAKAFNCYWPMPFGTRARVTIENDSPYDAGVFWYIDYETVPTLPKNTAYFHAQYRQEYPCVMGRDFLIADIVGKGQYVGTVQSAQFRTPAWFGEGDDRFYIDGAAEPQLRGTGTEDYFCDAWGYRPGMRPFYGITLFDGDRLGDRVTTYRWHIPDPIHFTKSLKVAIEHKGVMFDTNHKRVTGFMERQDLMSTVAFWYQTGKAKRFAEIPPYAERIVDDTRVECERALEKGEITAEPTETNLSKQESWMYSGNGQVFAQFAAPGGVLTIPFSFKSAKNGVGKVKLTKSWDYGIWRVLLDGKVLGGLEAVDLFSPTVVSEEFHAGYLELASGEHELRLECVGKDPMSAGYNIGVDALLIEHLTPYLVPPEEKQDKDEK